VPDDRVGHAAEYRSAQAAAAMRGHQDHGCAELFGAVDDGVGGIALGVLGRDGQVELAQAGRDTVQIGGCARLFGFDDGGGIDHLADVSKRAIAGGVLGDDGFERDGCMQ
jgi:hypothetical protein